LKALLPPIVEAYIESLLKSDTRKATTHVDIQTALSSIIYTLCKVRGAKVIVGFFNNEPRYLDPILTTLEDVTFNETGDEVSWKVSYVLLLWLSHLLLTPFDLASISARPARAESQTARMALHTDLPTVAQRVIQIGATHVSASTKAQDAAAAMLVRLASRPDMQRFRLADSLVKDAVTRLAPSAESPVTIYQQLGPLRFLAGVATSADVSHVLPDIYRACEKLSGDGTTSPVTENAVGKKLIVKIFRNIAILTLRLPSVSGPLLSFLETTSVLEDVIDHLLQSLGDRDTPVRYAAAKAISLIISELEPEMGHEVIQAVLDTFKEDIPRSTIGIDYQTVNALKWHGLTLTLSHALFKRSASPSQLLDILNALVSALNFEQRTATGSSVGTNVRDAANFGIWSLSRRYTSDELLSVDMKDLRSAASSSKQATVIQVMAVQLLLSACLDPAGNIRRGSSAALQELIGRHPNQVTEGISIVQIVDYQAVGLRKRGIVDVAGKAASLDRVYWEALVDGLVGWRGLSSVDVISREAAALSLATFVTIAGEPESQTYIAERLLAGLEDSAIESMHGTICSLSNLLDLPTNEGAEEVTVHRRYWQSLQACGILQVDFNPRTLKSELPVAIAKLIDSICRRESDYLEKNTDGNSVSLGDIESVVGRLLVRHERSIVQVVPAMVKQVNRLSTLTAQPSDCLDLQSLRRAVAADSSKAVLSGAGRAIALGAITLQDGKGLTTEEAALSISTLSNVVTVTNVDWRIIGLRALHLVIQDLEATSSCETEPLTILIQALHTGLTDYTIDERGDVGSLVRLQALKCTSSLLSLNLFNLDNKENQLLLSDTLRLSLEKLDRVRGRAAACRQQILPPSYQTQDHSNTNSKAYLRSALHPIFSPNTHPWARRALTEGAISCAGISGEALLQTSREVLTDFCTTTDPQHLHAVLTTFSEILRDILTSSTPNATNLMLPALDLLSFLLDMRIPQHLATTNTNTPFKWRTLLSTVQKSHHKSSDVPKLLAAVNVYRGLAEVESIRGEVVKKLLSMLTTNPYPRIKIAVADVVFEVLGAEEMKVVNWAEKGAAQARIVGELRSRYVENV
jgi:hypothetical protein